MARPEPPCRASVPERCSTAPGASWRAVSSPALPDRRGARPRPERPQLDGSALRTPASGARPYASSIRPRERPRSTISSPLLIVLRPGNLAGNLRKSSSNLIFDCPKAGPRGVEGQSHCTSVESGRRPVSDRFSTDSRPILGKTKGSWSPTTGGPLVSLRWAGRGPTFGRPSRYRTMLEA